MSKNANQRKNFCEPQAAGGKKGENEAEEEEGEKIKFRLCHLHNDTLNSMA